MRSPALEVVCQLADWSHWVPFTTARESAPRTPGVYLAREGATGDLVYVGMAGERHGQGIRGRLTVYARGKALASGLGEAVLDRALTDSQWLHDRIREVDGGYARRATQWGVLAFERADLHVSWTVTTDGPAARTLEKEILSALTEHTLWNRLR
ncbi:hypothetical protein VA596_42745 [Amycolatopsis sp., V23-08]|uniref:GIY-YIG nuclease family protein n=1 Tax=Amycolatopsis heterodermiae TaxID=3110235 RepID=A0ABU5RJ49_9PSEU|nr:hypothetical protein [Amycolatopsis sp., V23-08]MEA5366311.1 hypothetical protein [Amycolatopsis sp., V23-08]